MASKQLILTINGGSSTIKFTLCEPPANLQARPVRTLSGIIERIGLDGTFLQASAANGPPAQRTPIRATSHREAALALIQWLEAHSGVSRANLIAIGHRVVHGGIHLVKHQLITDELITELKRTQPLDLAHLPREIALIEVLREHFPDVPQVACFDTAFHRDLPRIAQLLPIPRRYDQAGLRRFGFHGLSYAYLMDELRQIDPVAADGRIILAHLGSGASMAAVNHGKPMDTTMAFTPTAGLVMGTRPGDLDPGLLVYLMRTEKLTPEQMDEFISHECGLLGISETTFDMRDLIAHRQTDVRAAEAVDLFCYQARKWIGAYAAALGGLDTLIFSGGIGEHADTIRAAICENLDFLGLHLDAAKNRAGKAVISTEQSRVIVRVIATDEEIMIVMAVASLINT